MSFTSDINKRFPALSLQTHVRMFSKHEERFTIDCAQDVVRIHSDSKLSEAFACHQLLAALESNRLGDIVGENAPLFPIRPLVVHASCRCSLPSGLSVNFPKQLFQDDNNTNILTDALSDLVSKTLDLGFNTLIFAPQQDFLPQEKTMPLSWVDLRDALDFIRSSGLKVGLHFSPQSLSTKRDENDWRHFFTSLASLHDSFDFLFWQQGELWIEGFESEKKEPTEFEKTREEIAFIEKWSKASLLYYLPCNDSFQAKRQAEWLLPLMYLAAPKTMIAFSSSNGNALIEDRAPHPLFSELSKQTIVTKTRLIPLLAMKQYIKEPNLALADLPFAFIDNILSRQLHMRFCGAGCRVADIPATGSFAEGPLWALGQRMWRPLNIFVLFESWILRYHKEVKDILSYEFSELLNKVWSAKGRIEFLASALLVPNLLEKELLIRLKDEIEEFVKQLLQLQQYLVQIADESYFRNFSQSASIQKLNATLLAFQAMMKKEIEDLSSRLSVKIPSSLQSYQPTSIITI